MALAQTYGDTHDDNAFDIDSLTMQEPVLPSAIAPLLSCRKGPPFGLDRDGSYAAACPCARAGVARRHAAYEKRSLERLLPELHTDPHSGTVLAATARAQTPRLRGVGAGEVEAVAGSGSHGVNPGRRYAPISHVENAGS